MGSEGKSTREFAAIDGIRSILSFWVVACHVVSLAIYFVYVGSPQQPDKLAYLSSAWWTFLAMGLGYQVDVFFMVSGFLTTWSLLTKQSHYSGKPRDLLMLVLRRLFRLWPVIIIAIIGTYFLGDLNSSNWTVLLSTLSFPINRSLPQAFGVNWSNRVDLLCTVILFVVFAIMKRNHWLTMPGAVGAVLLSLTPKVVRFAVSRELVSYLAVRMSGNPSDLFMPVYMTLERQQYYSEVLYPGQMVFAISEDPSPLKQMLMKHEYLVYHQRITPFFIGMVLALALQRARGVSVDARGVVNKLVHGVFMVFSLLITLQPLVLPLLTKKNSAKTTLLPGQLPPIGMDVFVSVINRPLYATAFAYLLFRCMLPVSHALHMHWLNTLLTSRILQALSVYSFSIYSLHMKVMMEIMWRYLPPRWLAQVFGSEACFLPIAFTVLLTYFVSLALAMVVYHWIEEPVAKKVAGPLLRWIDDNCLVYLRGDKKKEKKEK